MSKGYVSSGIIIMNGCKGETMKSRSLLSTLALVLAMLACNLPSNVPVTETPTTTVTVSPTLSLPTQTPTQTPLPTNTSPPPATSTPTVPTVSPKEVPVNCRLGPGTAWIVISALTVGQTSQIVGKNSDGTWWYIVDPSSSSRNCWVSVSVTNASGNLSNVPIVQTPKASVTRVTVDVNPETIAMTGTACTTGPVPQLEIEGTIETNGPTSVQWRFETQLGGAMTTQTTDFEAFGTKTFTAAYTPPLPITAGAYWVRLVVTSPNEAQSEAKYTITCP
jgi:hypothetical protein